jgi:transient receptor potential cation channel subfamily C member 4
VYVVFKAVMRDLIKRYIMKRQRTANSFGVSEDDINEIKQDISSFRYELLEILRSNGMATATSFVQPPQQSQPS